MYLPNGSVWFQTILDGFNAVLRLYKSILLDILESYACWNMLNTSAQKCLAEE